METDVQNLPEKITISQEQLAKYEEYRQVAGLLAFDIAIQWDVAKNGDGFEELMTGLKAEEVEGYETPEGEMPEEQYWFEVAKSLLWSLRELKENRDEYLNDEKKRQQQFGMSEMIFGTVASGQVRNEKTDD